MKSVDELDVVREKQNKGITRKEDKWKERRKRKEKGSINRKKWEDAIDEREEKSNWKMKRRQIRSLTITTKKKEVKWERKKNRRKENIIIDIEGKKMSLHRLQKRSPNSSIKN